MNLQHFRESPSGRLVEVPHGDRPYAAFVPNPLPPRLNVDLELLRRSSEAAYAIGELAALGRRLTNPHLLIGPFLRREAVSSSRIEGTQADMADLYAFEAGQVPLLGLTVDLPAGDVQEVMNYVTATEYALERLSSLPMSLRLIREAHEHLMPGVRGGRAMPGQFRDRQNYIGSSQDSIYDADYVPPPVSEMLPALDALERYIGERNDPYPPLVRLALIHYQFEAIHPFIDGNGRMGRLLITLLLVDWGLLPLPLLYLSAYFDQHRDRYCDLLQGVSEYGSWREWVDFFLDGVTQQANDANQRIKAIEDLQMDWEQRLSGRGRSTASLRLAHSLLAAPILTIPQAQRLLGMTYPAAQKNIERLVQAGILRQVGDARYGRAYVAEELLSILVRPLARSERP